VKIEPNITVLSKDTTEVLYLLISIAWWHQVTETPEDTKIIVFKKGIPIGSKQLIPDGGQKPPSSVAGDSAKWI